ncbi:hypothetical protein [Frankia canadensis]|uniref:hypothetical protein n=1 Tax=Frankia canadensis TaxID=1836972 RepID=UPI001FAF2A14|nr:hypothetical protein [Frankia canadensis]
MSFLLLTRVAFGLGGRERSLTAMVSGVAAAQVLLHMAFLLAHPHVHLACLRCSVDSQMFLAHMAAGLAVSLSLRRAERALWSATRLRPGSLLVVLLLPATEPAAPPVAPVVKIGCRRRPPRAHSRPLGRSARRRGPPWAWPEVDWTALRRGMPRTVR